jgi:hypothetical protein
VSFLLLSAADDTAAPNELWPKAGLLPANAEKPPPPKAEVVAPVLAFEDVDPKLDWPNAGLAEANAPKPNAGPVDVGAAAAAAAAKGLCAGILSVGPYLKLLDEYLLGADPKPDEPNLGAALAPKPNPLCPNAGVLADAPKGDGFVAGVPIPGVGAAVGAAVDILSELAAVFWLGPTSISWSAVAATRLAMPG